MYNAEMTGILCSSRVEVGPTGFYKRRLMTPSFFNLAHTDQPDIYNDLDVDFYEPDTLDPFHSELRRLILKRNEPKPNDLPPDVYGYTMDCVNIQEPYHLFSPLQIQQLLQNPHLTSNAGSLGYRIETIGNIDRYYR